MVRVLVVLSRFRLMIDCSSPGGSASAVIAIVVNAQSGADPPVGKISAIFISPPKLLGRLSHTISQLLLRLLEVCTYVMVSGDRQFAPAPRSLAMGRFVGCRRAQTSVGGVWRSTFSGNFTSSAFSVSPMYPPRPDSNELGSSRTTVSRRTSGWKKRRRVARTLRPSSLWTESKTRG